VFLLAQRVCERPLSATPYATAPPRHPEKLRRNRDFDADHGDARCAHHCSGVLLLLLLLMLLSVLNRCCLSVCLSVTVTRRRRCLPPAY